MGMMINKIYNKILKNFWLNCSLTVIPSIFFLAIKVIGKNIGLVNKQDDLTFLGGILFSIFIFFTFAYGVIKSYCDCHMNSKKSETQNILQNVASSTTSVCNNKFHNLIEYIEKSSQKEKLPNIIRDTMKPEIQIKELLKELEICLNYVTGIGRDNIEISIFQKFDFWNKWECKYYRNTNSCEINNIVSDVRSTANQVINGQYDSLFFHDKRQAIEKNQYLPNVKDQASQNEGSIICLDMSLRKNNIKYISSVLNISTYGEKIISKDDKELKNKIKHFVIDPFLLRIKMELCNEYILELYNNQEFSKENKVIPIDSKVMNN
ncbi:hypothetical protein [Clostridium acetobutylicum]|nr:hypothetical protein [Clostridium acetobutylicum]